jgi:hypothetical protein
MRLPLTLGKSACYMDILRGFKFIRFPAMSYRLGKGLEYLYNMRGKGVLLLYRVEDAILAFEKLYDRYFAGRIINVRFYDEEFYFQNKLESFKFN